MDKKEKSIIYIAHTDVAFIRDFVERMGSLDIAVEAFSQGRELLVEFRKHKPLAAVISTLLSDMDGLQAIDALHDLYGNSVPVVAVLHNDSVDLQAQAVKRSVLCKFIPPVNINEVTDVIARLYVKKAVQV
ncbi:MAG: hypothetical protein A2268_07590 [Candidatus Raymondbacteria bacterium RifOxyA12_full_50_37]|uniref:Response regulatory domain-containing protein n=1 Tax=Candidatus Raymondbacteria bacterium RIFOXYD12_FULL_49_13 TaxID=1817890 RepID=A0A1F7F370_UNCRA|nr:MAG: hypothetical protein A2248_05200 [Candidatus Raymondbacteria bacterium RIFOXYA2_FULL_49_16]OGJ90107.1 MAG: hypothetical protein A2268_07590 [Candidatus Raymondbacteria bacterium RifOxyA12_full_50_37]OGJ94658.1 MAG: hypothetical protein A2350_08425 [Candidatus Raymondbacteria bacterium RifOxyB12_full_50_8]OGJ97685.1 MAG: hypothetical protein A2453_09560 [Candidatus Raymondbacteria bacterium RIFOXYC2_FULL_50_21]OGK01048.1 MAG: hypothetical protein A2519_16820 [Candidatus Raymondbacteria b